MKKFFAPLALVSIFAFLATPITASAQEGSWGTHQGQIEVNLIGSFGASTIDIDGEDLKIGGTRLNGTIGYLATDALEVGLRLTVTGDTTEFLGTTEETSGYFGQLFGAWNFNTGSNVTPYVGLGVGSGSSESASGDTLDVLQYGLFGGAKFFLSEWAAITGEVGYDMMTYELSDGDSYDGTDLTINFGISVFFN